MYLIDMSFRRHALSWACTFVGVHFRGYVREHALSWACTFLSMHFPEHALSWACTFVGVHFHGYVCEYALSWVCTFMHALSWACTLYECISPHSMHLIDVYLIDFTYIYTYDKSKKVPKVSDPLGKLSRTCCSPDTSRLILPCRSTIILLIVSKLAEATRHLQT